jgi:monovalent cation/hydrogen antiporter
MHPAQVFEFVFVMLLAILALHWIALRLRLPPAVALLIGGGALAFIPGLPTIELDPELVLVLFLPPLLMDGAYFTAHAEFRKHIAGVLSLAVGAVVFTTLIVGVVAHWLMPELPWAACFALGAIVSPPDAVSARAVLQTVKLPRRLSTLLEGESLLNDATGLVLFRFAVAAVLTGTFSATAAAGEFLLLAVGGVVIGAVVCGIWIIVMKRLKDEQLIIVSAVLMCWGAYISAEAVHVSGVIATVTAGLMFGWFQHTIFSARVRMRATAFWQIMVFIFEAFIFILIGLSLRNVLLRVGGIDVVLQEMAGPVLVIVIAMTAARFLWVFGSDIVLASLSALGFDKAKPLGASAATVLSWAGMRGVVTLAVALTLPETVPGRDFMLVTAFAVILVTVLLQGTTLGAIIRLLGLGEDEEHHGKLSESQAAAIMMAAKKKAVEERAYDGDGKLVHPQLLERYTRRATMAQQYAGNESEHVEHINAHFDVILAAVQAGRHELMRLHRAGKIDEETLQSLERELDIEEIGALNERV